MSGWGILTNTKNNLNNCCSSLPNMEYFHNKNVQKDKHLKRKYEQVSRLINSKVPVSIELGNSEGFWHEYNQAARQITLDVHQPKLGSGGEHYIQDLNETWQNVPTANIIYAMDVIEHLYSPEFVLQQIHNHLQPAGRVVITVPNDVCRIDNILKFFNAPIFKHGSHIRYFNLKTLKQLVEKSGFRVEKIGVLGSNPLRHINKQLFGHKFYVIGYRI